MPRTQAVYYRAPDGSEPVNDFIDQLTERKQPTIDLRTDRLDDRAPSAPPLPFPHSSDGVGSLSAGACVEWRYITNDNDWVMVKDRLRHDSRASWVFIRRAALDPSIRNFPNVHNDYGPKARVAACRGTYELDAAPQAGRRGPVRVLARSRRYSLAAAARVRLGFRLGASARRLLRDDHGRLAAILRITPSGRPNSSSRLSLEQAQRR